MSTRDTPWRALILTLFPEMFPGPLGVSLAGKALASGPAFKLQLLAMPSRQSGVTQR